MFAYTYTALVTLLSVLFCFWAAGMVGRARATYGIKAPATTGQADFERINRIHLNTVENMVMFLPALWLFAFLIGDLWAALVGVFFPIGRVIYARGYREAADKRGPGGITSAISIAVLTLGALVGVVVQFIS